MQSIFRLPWCTDPAGEEKPDKAMLSKMRQQPVVDMTLLNKLKRKRFDSQSLEPLPSLDGNKRQKLSEVEHNGLSLPGRRQTDGPKGDGSLDSASYNIASCAPPHSISAKPSLNESDDGSVAGKPNIKHEPTTTPSSVKPTKCSEVDDMPALSEAAAHTQLQEVIEHQFNIEILLKHRELRLIEQELAKCQTALEQLRRCEVIPYPGATGLSESLSSGTGPALKPQPGHTEPQAPPPWGVTDGPYTRHYAKWLLNDPTFDSVPFNHVFPSCDNYAMQPEGRSTRNSGAGLGKATKSRAARDSVGNLNHALPNYPLQPRGKQGPLVIKRLADNQFVKLICNNCQRGDFSSVQGFLNHCRIAHKVDYKSHEAAALDCGRLLDDDEGHLIPQGGVPPTASGAPKPQAPKIAAAVVPQPVLPGFVHPLNAPALPRHTWKSQAAAARASVSQLREERQKVAGTTNIAKVKHSSTPLVGSASTPYLSAQFAKRGLGGDLQRATNQAREKIDLGPDPVDDEDAPPTPVKSQEANVSVIDASRAMVATPQFGPQFHKNQQSLSRPRPAPIVSRHVPSHVVPESPSDVNLSPHTADSDPGLVSDHEDDDATSDLDEARSDRHHSPAAAANGLPALRGGTCGDAMEMEMEIEVEDEADEHSVLIRPRSHGLQMRTSGSPSRGPKSGRYGETAK